MIYKLIRLSVEMVDKNEKMLSLIYKQAKIKTFYQI